MDDYLYESKIITFDQYLKERLYFDAIVSIGVACRPSHYLKRFRLRYFSSPFDWMMSYKLDTISIYREYGFSNFFTDYKIIGKSNSNYKVQDNYTGMISMHDFPISVPVEEFLPFFHKSMRCKYDTLLR